MAHLKTIHPLDFLKVKKIFEGEKIFEGKKNFLRVKKIFEGSPNPCIQFEYPNQRKCNPKISEVLVL